MAKELTGDIENDDKFLTHAYIKFDKHMSHFVKELEEEGFDLICVPAVMLRALRDIVRETDSAEARELLHSMVRVTFSDFLGH
jgi:uncharacterized membrane protein